MTDTVPLVEYNAADRRDVQVAIIHEIVVAAVDRAARRLEATASV